VFRTSLHHILVRFFQCFNSPYAKSNNFSEPVLQHLVNVYCKPYLLYGTDIINWTDSELSNCRFTLNSAMCKIYIDKLLLLLLPTVSVVHCSYLFPLSIATVVFR